MHRPSDLAQMLADRAHDPHRAVIEAVMMRDMVDQLDDHLHALELHLWSDHVAHHDDPGAEAALSVVVATRLRIGRLLAKVDTTMAKVDTE